MTPTHDHPVILVDRADRAIGVADKMQVHRIGRLHRAFSIFVFDRHGRLLLQRRSRAKYHSAGLWSNTCCGHPRWGERVIESGQRRLKEEMGFTCKLRWFAALIYRADVGSGLIEYEYDHVLFGRHDSDPDPDAGEVLEWEWRRHDAVLKSLRRTPDDYSAWFRFMLLTRAIGTGFDRAATMRRSRKGS
jgi:isopentenyl-diphosphate delta-isomerase